MKRKGRLQPEGKFGRRDFRLKHAALPDSMFDQRQLVNGIHFELQKTDDVELAKQLAKSNLARYKDYYIYLPRLEKALKTNFVARNVKQKLTPNFPWSLKIY
jgi:hypothetical protein